MVDLRNELTLPLRTKGPEGSEHVFHASVEEDSSERVWIFRVFRTVPPAPADDFYEARVVRTSQGTAYTYTLAAHAEWAADVGIPAALLPLIQRIVGAEITSPPIHARVMMTLEEVATWAGLREQGLAVYDTTDRVFRFKGT